MKTRMPSTKALAKAFPDANAVLIRDLLTNFESVEQYLSNYGLCAQFYNPPAPRYARMLALNHALGFHGVEHAGQEGERGFTYLNTGDAYGVTLIQFDDKDSIFISWQTKNRADSRTRKRQTLSEFNELANHNKA